MLGVICSIDTRWYASTIHDCQCDQSIINLQTHSDIMLYSLGEGDPLINMCISHQHSLQDWDRHVVWANKALFSTCSLVRLLCNYTKCVQEVIASPHIAHAYWLAQNSECQGYTRGYFFGCNPLPTGIPLTFTTGSWWCRQQCRNSDRWLLNKHGDSVRDRDLVQ